MEYVAICARKGKRYALGYSNTTDLALAVAEANLSAIGAPDTCYASIYFVREEALEPDLLDLYDLEEALLEEGDSV